MSDVTRDLEALTECLVAEIVFAFQENVGKHLPQVTIGDNLGPISCAIADKVLRSFICHPEADGSRDRLARLKGEAPADRQRWNTRRHRDLFSRSCW